MPCFQTLTDKAEHRITDSAISLTLCIPRNTWIINFNISD